MSINNALINNTFIIDILDSDPQELIFEQYTHSHSHIYTYIEVCECPKYKPRTPRALVHVIVAGHETTVHWVCGLGFVRDLG